MKAVIAGHMEKTRKEKLGQLGLRAYLLNMEEPPRSGYMLLTAVRDQIAKLLASQFHSQPDEAFKAWRIHEANLARQGWEPVEPNGAPLPPTIEADPELWGFRIELGSRPDWQHLAPVKLAYELASQSLLLAKTQDLASEESFVESFLRAEREIGTYARLRGSGFGLERDQELLRRYAELRPRYVSWLQRRDRESNIDPVGGGNTPQNKTMEAI